MLIENLGAEVFIHLSIKQKNNSNNDIIMRLSNKAAVGIRIHQTIDFGFLVDSLLIFDSQGKRIDRCVTNQSLESLDVTDIISGASNA